MNSKNNLTNNNGNDTDLSLLDGYDNVVVHRERKETSLESFRLLFDKLLPLVKDMNEFYYIVDRSQTINNPSQEEREELRDLVKNLTNMKQLMFVQDQNRMFQMLAKFMLGRQLKKEISFHKTFDDAVHYLEKHYE